MRHPPEPYQPTLTRWSHAWRLILMLAISGIAWGSVVEQQASETPWLFWIDLGLGLLSFFLVHLRRRWPLAIALIITALAAVSALAAGPAVLAAVSLATRRRLPEIVAVGGLALVSGLVNFQLYDEDGLWWVQALLSVAFVAAQLGWGMYLGSRRELMWTLHQRAERAEAEQSLRAAQARATERARIAREMHDALAHRISQVSMHAGALAYRTDLGADELRAGAADIQRQANQALTDLRGVLGVLRDPGTADVPDPPQPTYDLLPQLVAEAEATGMPVDYADELVGAELPEGLGRTVYRIVQEGITNVRKHAPGALLTIRLTGDPASGLSVVMRNRLGFAAAAAPGAGLGLVGLTERAQLREGWLRHGVDGAWFTLEAWLPWAP